VPPAAAGAGLAARRRLPRPVQPGGLLNDARQRRRLPRRRRQVTHQDPGTRRLAAAAARRRLMIVVSYRPLSQPEREPPIWSGVWLRCRPSRVTP